MWRVLAFAPALALVGHGLGCGGGDDEGPTPDAGPNECPAVEPFPIGDPDGHPEPLGAGPDQARAGRIAEEELPEVPSGLITWKGGDFVLANDRIAVVIEDVGASDLYDPWGGRPVGVARVEGGVLVDPANFGEFFLLTGRSTVLTQSVTVLNDGSNGEAAVIRTRGPLRPLPFIDILAAPLATFDHDAVIDYELAPGAEHVTIRTSYQSHRTRDQDVASILHALMYTERMPLFLPNSGFSTAFSDDEYMALVDDAATSWSYVPGGGARLGVGLAASGFVGTATGGFTVPACGTTTRVHAELVIGGPGLDGIQAATARFLQHAQREITGTVERTGAGPVAGVRVHAVGTDGTYYSRATTDADGGFALHVPADATVTLETYRRGDAGTSATHAPSDGPAALAIPNVGRIHVTALDAGSGAALPARVQVLPVGGGPAIPSVPEHYGEPEIPSGRLQVEYTMTGDVTVTAPPGAWEVVVSRGYEYELERRDVTVVAGATAAVDVALERSVATPGVVCGDFHVHTDRSNDSADPGLYKVASAVADGVELPVRSDHEWVGDFAAEITSLGVGAWAKGIGSIELTSMEVWGHMGVFPLTADPAQVNHGAPRWQTYPTAEDPDAPVTLLSPPAVFDAVRARPEQPVVIINHPRGNTNYFGYVRLDPATGLVDPASLPDWDTQFTLIEVFNNSSWTDNLGGNVADWFGLLRAGRHVFAVGSSDSHGVKGSPVGYPRTCIPVDTDDPSAVSAALVRDRMAAGHHTVSGGIYVTAQVGTAGPGDTASGLGPSAEVDVEIQAATWIDVDAIDVVVDGTVVDTIPIMPGDADPDNPVVRWRGAIPVTVSAAGNGFVVIAAYGDAAMQPVHAGKRPFGVTNPIFLAP
jgi:hypothetical protein